MNIKFGDTKSVVYLTQTDLDLTPPSGAHGAWNISCSAQPARTDRSGQGLAAFKLQGRWYRNPQHMDLDLVMDRAGLGQISALFSGQTGGVHGDLTVRLHLAGPLDNLGVAGRVALEDVHRWDMLPTQGSGWALDVGGKIDLLAQKIELESMSAKGAPLPLALKFHAENYLSQPHWSAAMFWNQFPIGPILELARHMGMQFPQGLKLSGTMDGELDYASGQGFDGLVAFRDAALALAGSPPISFEQAKVTIEKGRVKLEPTVVRTSTGEESNLEAVYDADRSSLDLSISAEAMKVASLRSQVAMAAVPWMEQLTAGTWAGSLRYHCDATASGWSGKLQLTGAEIPIPGLADTVKLASARVRIDGARVTLDHAKASVGSLEFNPEYSYEPGAARPHRLVLLMSEEDAADLETELMPTLRRAGLIGQALGRAPVPDWLKDRQAEGSVQIKDLVLAGVHLKDAQARIVWDGPRVDLTGIKAKMDTAAFTGALSVDLRGTRPAYKLTAKAKGLVWQGGKVDADGTAATSGFGAQTLANASVTGSFSATGVDLGFASACRSAVGDFAVDWQRGVARLRFANLTVRADEVTLMGRGASQEEGRIAITLSGGGKTVELGGTLDRLKVEEPPR